MIKNKLKELQGDSKKLKVQTVLVFDYKKRNDRKIFHSSTKPITSNSEVDEAFISVHQSNITKIKNYASKDWVVLYLLIKHIIKVSEC